MILKLGSQHRTHFWVFFARGLTQPSWVALASTLLFTSLLFAGLTSAALEKWSLDNMERFRKRGVDDSALDATMNSIKLRRDRQASNAIILLIGETQWGQEIKASLGDLGFVHSEIIDLTTEGQTIWESEALIDWTSSRNGIVLFDASLERFLESESQLKRLAMHPKLGFRSRAFDRELESAGLTTRSLYDRYLLDNVSFFVDRWPNAVLNTAWGTCQTSLAPEVSPKKHDAGSAQAFEINKKAFSRFMEIATRKTQFSVIVFATDSPTKFPHLLDARNKLITQLSNSSRILAIFNEANTLVTLRDRIATTIQATPDQHNERRAIKN